MARVLSERLRPGDVLVPAALFVVAAVEMLVVRPERWPVALLTEGAAALLLVGRRRWPLAAPTLACAVLLAQPWLGPAMDEVSGIILFLVLSCFSLGRRLPDLRGLVGMAVIWALTFVDYVTVDLRTHDISDVVFVATLSLPPYLFGRLVHRLDRQKELLEERQELVRREAVRDERDRIAREMHDVIAHSVSAMVVQTAAAQDLVRTDPDRAERVLADVAETGRKALAETGRLLHVLRDDDDELGLEPAPGLADLAGLVAGFRASGLDVDLDVPDPLPQLPSGLDVSAYRIVQEALTNALRYGSDRTARLTLAATATVLSIEATNPSDASVGSGSGLGLLGMAERVSVLGGRLTHGRREDGCFELCATLPVPP